jgi:RNA polymerase sigma-70 factor (ECF subfamily)
VKGATPVSDADLELQRRVVGAFLAAAREGDFEGLVAVLDPDVVLRADVGGVAPGASRVIRGAPAVADQALAFARRYGRSARPALVNGAAGVVAASERRLMSVLGFTVTRGKIVEIDILADPDRLSKIALEDVAERSPDPNGS